MASASTHVKTAGPAGPQRILATSREPLGITGEALWLVEPLAVPEEKASPGEIESSPAVRLLRDRASAVWGRARSAGAGQAVWGRARSAGAGQAERRDLAADARTLPTMARVCRALDGMPLAVELAAARLRTMSIDQLANRLDDRFRLLTTGSRTALPRHRTLRAVVDWSWELLSDAERMVLRRLSVFWGGASLEAAERVCAGDAVEQEQVLELLTSLAEKSLLRAEMDRDGEAGRAPRYRMIGTIKEYAGHRLAEAGNRTRRATRISATSPNSPRPRSRIFAGPSNWIGSPPSKPSTTTSVPRCVVRSRPARRRRRCGSRRPPAGTGGSAGTGPKASS